MANQAATNSSPMTPSPLAIKPLVVNLSKAPVNSANNSVSSPPSQLIPDSGCSGHYMMTNTSVINSTPVTPGIFVQLPDGSSIESSHKANLNISGLPAATSECHTFPSLKSRSLLSMDWTIM
eukprot:scaffold26242_cov50-Attheya_sp.AAC.2